MYILTLENQAYEMNEIPDEVEDLRFAILDNSDPKNPDYFFIPLIFLESFNSPALVLRIGNNIVKMPVDWQILIGEQDFGDLEVIPLTSINDRGFSAYTFNPLESFKPEFHPVEIVDIYQDVKWYFPKLKPGHMLAVPLSNDPEPICAYFIKDLASVAAMRSNQLIGYGLVVGLQGTGDGVDVNFTAQSMKTLLYRLGVAVEGPLADFETAASTGKIDVKNSG